MASYYKIKRVAHTPSPSSRTHALQARSLQLDDWAEWNSDTERNDMAALEQDQNEMATVIRSYLNEFDDSLASDFVTVYMH